MAGYVAAALLSCLLAAGCVTTTRPPALMPAPAPQSETSPNPGGDVDEVPWSSRPLVWDNFKGSAPTDGVEGAHTVYLLSYESRCRGAEFQFFVTAVFLPVQSWVKRHVLADPAESLRILRHEQTHFNLTEVYARRMRKYFAELYNPCGQTDEQLNASVDRFVQDEAAAQRRYDNETGYGLVQDRQRGWDKEVAGMLASLAGFARE
jgi:hypothetical protein